MNMNHVIHLRSIKEANLSAKEVSELLSYDKVSGKLFWKVHRAPQRPIGSEAGTRGGNSGYVQVMINGKLFVGHRLAWAIVYGAWPEADIDHVNGIRHDNRWVNLRAASNMENTWNVRKSRNPKSSIYKGVSFHKLTGKWMAYVCKGGKMNHLGLFQTEEEEAKAARDELAAELHGEFFRS